ncbi:MAG: amino acid ABC transporter substrate-binding protein, partial [Spirochaetia bacterium]|nr:amino acid ABC transporter substrate-binding protein [Spirochaetia bacterium]
MNKSLKNLLALAVIGLTAFSSFAKPKFRTVDQIKKNGTIRIAVFSDKKPFGYVDEYGKYQGYDVYFAE